MLTCVLSSK